MAALPISDDYPTRRAPIVTYLIIAANVVVYLMTPIAALLDRYGMGDTRQCAQMIFLYEWAAIPRELLSGHQIPFSALHNMMPGPCLDQLQQFHKTVWLSPLWAMFLHGGTLHILGNMLYLYVFGARVEDRLGRLRYLLCYLMFGYVSAYCFALTAPGSASPLIGASGAIAGVLGCYLVLSPRNRVTTVVLLGIIPIPFRVPGWVTLGSWFVMQWFFLQINSEDGTAYAAHVYGFLAGMLLGLVLRRSRNTYGTGALFAWK